MLNIDHYCKRRDICSCLGDVTTLRQWCKPRKGPCSNDLQSSSPWLLTLMLSLASYVPQKARKLSQKPKQLLAGRTDSAKNQSVGGYTSIKFEPYFFHLPFAWNNGIINLPLGVCYLFIGLLKNIILYATGLWIIINYNSHSELVLNKLLAKTISVSEHNLPLTKHSLWHQPSDSLILTQC